MLGFNTNFMSLMTRRQLDNTTNILNLAVERMTTGFKVNHASDNAANYSIIQQMDTQISALDVAEDNASVGLDLLTTANDTLDLINERFIRLRNLAVQAENGTYGKSSLDSINIECKALVEEIKRIYKEAEFNGLRIYGSEFFETIPTDGTQPIATLGVDDEPEPVSNMSTTFATEATTLQELGIDYSSFEIYNSTGSLIESYEVEKTDTLGDIFNVLNTYGIAATMTDGVISLSSTNGRYVYGELIESFGITLDSDDFIAESSQTSEKMYCVVNENANEASTLAQLGALASGTDIITVKDKFGDKVADISVDSNTTLGGLFNKLGNYDIQGTVDDGVITFSSSEGNYLLSQGVIANLGIGVVEGSSVVTTGTGQTSADIVTYETITSTGGTVTTTQEEHTVTIWTTTTTSQTVTNTVWTTTTTSQTVTGTYYVTTTTPQTVTETIWTTTTTSTTETETILTTTTALATGSTTFAQLGLSGAQVYKLKYNSAYYTKTVQATDTIDTFFNQLKSYGVLNASITNGVIDIDLIGYKLEGTLPNRLGISTETINYTNYQQITFTVAYTGTVTNDSAVTGTSTVAAGQFKASVSTIYDTTTLLAISELDPTVAAGGVYKVCTPEDLLQLAEMTNNGLLNSSTSYGRIVLANDIDMSSVNWTQGIDGSYIYNFYGNGHVISNLTGSIGLFDCCHASIVDLGLVDVNITVTETRTKQVGALLCYQNASNSSAKIANCFVTGEMDIGNNDGAGLVGYLMYNMENCYASVNIKSAKTAAGLVYKVLSSTIKECFTEGTVSGADAAGIVYDGRTTKNVLSSANVIGTNTASGIVGISDPGDVISNAYFCGSVQGSKTAAILLRFVENSSSTVLPSITSVRSTASGVPMVGETQRYLKASKTLKNLGIAGGNMVITKDGVTTTLSIADTKTITQVASMLKPYDIFLRVYLSAQYGQVLEMYVPSSVTISGTGLVAGVTKSTIINSSTSSTAHSVTTTASTTQTETIWSTTTTSTTQTNTIYETTTTETTGTETVWTTTTSSTTNTETVWETTTSSTTQTETVDVVKTIGGSTTTTNVSMTADTSFALLELDSRGYVTVMNGSTRTIITVKTGDTVSDLISKLDKSGITATLNNGRLTLTPDAKSIYISGMSTNLIDALNLESDFYTSSLGVEMTDSNFINYDANTTIKANTSLSEIGVTSGELLVQKDGANYATIAVSDSQTVGSFTQQLADVGFDVKLANGAILISSEGDMLLTNAASDSSNAISVFSLGSVSQRIETTYANTDSSEIYKLAQIVNSYWKSTSAICLQVGTTGDESSRIEICTGFDIHDLDRFASIGKKTVNNIDYIKELDNIINTISAKQTEIGAYENRLESALEEISIRYENMVSSRSTLRDADLSEITSIYIQQQILQQASATLLSVANQSPQLALQLL